MSAVTVAAIIALIACGFGLALWMIRNSREKRSVAFFHPNCLSRGGGEFVLWSALSAMSREDPSREYVVYTSSAVRPQEALVAITRAATDFGLIEDDPELPNRLSKCMKFIRVRTASLIFYPYSHFTLILQSLAGALAGLEALWKYTPEVFIDTTGGGSAFALPVFRYIGGVSNTLAYVHYPTITSKMISDVASDNTESVCNRRELTPTQKSWKLRYYNFFEKLYRFAGASARLAMANGSWTAGHLQQLWPNTRIVTVFPPCTYVSPEENEQQPVLPEKDDEPLLIVSIGQYRPEKQHMFQVNVMHKLVLKYPEHMGRVRLVMIGSTRGEEDEKLRAKVEQAAAQRGLIAMGAIDMPRDVNSSQKSLYLRRAVVGLHTMCDEHFGICVVEYMAAGAVPLSHDSAGPKMDIVVPSMRASDIPTLQGADEAVGMLATTEDEYTECLHALLSNPELRENMARRAMLRSRSFSVKTFEDQFRTNVAPFLSGDADFVDRNASSHNRQDGRNR